MSIDKLIDFVDENVPGVVGVLLIENIKEIKTLLMTSRDVIKHGRDDSIKQKLFKDISECLGE